MYFLFQKIINFCRFDICLFLFKDNQLVSEPNLALVFFHFFISFVIYNLPLFLIIPWLSFAAGSPYTFEAALSVNWQCFRACRSLMGFHKFMLSIFR